MVCIISLREIRYPASERFQNLAVVRNILNFSYISLLCTGAESEANHMVVAVIGAMKMRRFSPLLSKKVGDK